MTKNKHHQVFQGFDAIHVGSKDDVIHIQQGDISITMPAALAPNLIEALDLARKGEL